MVTNMRPYRTVAAALATILTSLALATTFESISWFPIAAGAVLMVAGAGLLGRLARVPWWLQPPIAAIALWVYLMLALVRTGPLGGVLPTPTSLSALVTMVSDGFSDIAELTTPVAVTPGLALLTTIGLGFVAIVVDLIAVGLRRGAVAGIALLAVYAVPIGVTGDGVPWPAFAAGAAGYLWLLTIDNRDRVLAWGRLMRPDTDDRSRLTVSPPSLSTRLGGASRLAAIGIVVALLVPMALPELPGTNLASLASGPGFGGGGARKVAPPNPITTLRGSLSQPVNFEVMRVRTNNPRPQYLRTATLDRVNPTGWTLSEMRLSSDNRLSRGARITGDQPTGSTSRVVQASIAVKGLRQARFLPIYPYPSKVDIDGDWRLDPTSGTVVSTRDVADDANYSLTAQQSEYEREELQASMPLAGDDPMLARYTQLPTLPPRVDAILNPLIAGETTEYDKVLAIRKFFEPSNGFQYTLETRPGTSGSDLVDFLTNKRGYCEQYASAMAYLVRAAGIPARVAVGFTRGSKVGGDQWSIKSRDSHAWVEVYFGGLGWVTFDPTPPYRGSNAATFPWAEGPDTDDPDAGTQPSEDPSPTPSASAKAPNGGKLDQDDRLGAAAAAAGSPPPSSGPPAWLWWAGAAALLLALAVVPMIARRRLRRRRLTLAARDPREGPYAGWDELLDTLVDLRMDILPAETPRATAERLSTGIGGGSVELTAGGVEAIRRLAYAIERARYAPPDQPSGAEVSPDSPDSPGLDSAVRQLTTELRRSVRFRRRLAAVLTPASTMARISSRITAVRASLANLGWRLTHPRRRTART